MSVSSFEIQLLNFTENEKKKLGPAFMFGDAEEILSFAVDQLGSNRVTDLILAKKDSDIVILAIEEVSGLLDDDKKRLRAVIT